MEAYIARLETDVIDQYVPQFNYVQTVTGIRRGFIVLGIIVYIVFYCSMMTSLFGLVSITAPGLVTVNSLVFFYALRSTCAVLQFNNPKASISTQDARYWLMYVSVLSPH